jgi:anaerobic magnesium-protoporphyrin IX monomethyl ester cyclase
MNYVFSLPIDDFNLAKFTPFPGSPLYEHIHELGEFNETIADMDCMHFVFVPTGMTRERLEELFIKFYKTHFKRPAVLWGYVTMIWKSPDSWRRFLGSLAKFIKFARSNKRIDESK